MNPDPLTQVEKERYSRQMQVNGIGEAGQSLIKNAIVGVIGIGGLGSPVCMYLAAAGIGQLIMVDDQEVELSNLNRQLLHWQDDAEASRMKVDSASDKLTSMNPGLKIWKHAARVQSSNISKILGDADILVDCTDNFETRMVMNDYAVRSGKPLVHGAVESLHGQITTVLPGKTPCLRCIFPKPPGRRGPIAVLGPAAGAIGAIQAAEVVKLITGVGEPLFGRLLVIDLLANCCEIIAFERDPDCISCKHVEG